ncbi:MarR family winged helix-turn-helix transcriptional regulator [Glycomyces arizonensis]|uniref:MarR family winged helix-turn-helix transcriptional regulator n=1 Tax=Glycomyces arizonensis TaxID=256035 RepID=UPI000400E709|nr:MarR family transcriptional regulator [Glycomyces arizonensis]
MDTHRLHHLLTDLLRTTGLVLMDRAVPGHPASLSQLFALHELDLRSGLSQRELAERLGLEKSTVSRLVTDLESDGLVRRERDPDNRRLYRLEITDAGRRLHREIASAVHPRYLQWIEGMTPAEREGLEIGLPALLRAMHGEPRPPEE